MCSWPAASRVSGGTALTLPALCSFTCFRSGWGGQATRGSVYSSRLQLEPAGAPGTYWCDPPGKYAPDFRAERFQLPYAFAANRPNVADVRLASSSPTAPAATTMPTFGYGQEIAVTYTYVDVAFLGVNGSTAPQGVVNAVDRVSLVAPGANANSLDSDQRVVFLQVRPRPLLFPPFLWELPSS
jgi:hypothetical protein